MGLPVTDPMTQLGLPPGFRFYPTDEELVVQYLCRKVAGHDFSLQIIADIDLYKFDPWVLPSKAMFGEKEWYFFSPRDRKYPNGTRPNRVAGSGYWKATGTDKVITTGGRTAGIKKSLVFYVGKAPKGNKTNWIMHEYRLSDPQRKHGTLKLDEWVLCRIYKKNSSAQKAISGAPKTEPSHGSSTSSSSQFEGVLESLPEIEDRVFNLPRVNSVKSLEQLDQKPNLQKHDSGNYDWASIAAFVLPEPLTGGVQSLPPQNPTTNTKVGSSMAPIYNMDTKFRKSIEDEVQSGIRGQRVDHPSYFQSNPNPFAQTQSLSGTNDPFGIRYPTQQGGIGFRQ